MKEFIPAGRIVNTHGISGEVKIEVWLDSPRYMKLFRRLFVGAAMTECKVVSSRVQKDFLLVRLEGYDDINAAMTLKNEQVSIARSDAALPKGAYFQCDIIGARVYDEHDCEIGILEEIIENPAQPIYVVRGEKEHLIPAVPEFVLSADPEASVLRVRLIPGM